MTPQPPRQLRGGDRLVEFRFRPGHLALPESSPAYEERAPKVDGQGVVTAKVLSYNVVDDYGTTFRPGVFAESLSQRLPVFVWAHLWSDPIGRAVGYLDDDTDGLQMTFQLDDFESVPRARQAFSQLRSGTLADFSVGFLRQADRAHPTKEGVTEIVKGQLDEVSVVLRGAVPGTKLLSARAGRCRARR